VEGVKGTGQSCSSTFRLRSVVALTEEGLRAR
jgi:hypothetical protein